MVVGGAGLHEAPRVLSGDDDVPLKLGPKTTVTVPGFEGALGKENKYSDNFFAWAHDFNKDGWNDILIIGFPGKETSWFENPKGTGTHWARHIVFDQTDNESPTFADLTGDGKPELVCITKGRYGYAEPDWKNPAQPWRSIRSRRTTTTATSRTGWVWVTSTATRGSI